MKTTKKNIQTHYQRQTLIIKKTQQAIKFKREKNTRTFNVKVHDFSIKIALVLFSH